MFKILTQITKKKSIFLKNNSKFTKNFTNNLSNDSFLTCTSGIYIEKMFQLWKSDPKSVHVSWDIYFSNINKGLSFSESFQSSPIIDKG